MGCDCIVFLGVLGRLDGDADAWRERKVLLSRYSCNGTEMFTAWLILDIQSGMANVLEKTGREMDKNSPLIRASLRQYNERHKISRIYCDEQIGL